MNIYIQTKIVTHDSHKNTITQDSYEETHKTHANIKDTCKDANTITQTHISKITHNHTVGTRDFWSRHLVFAMV